MDNQYTYYNPDPDSGNQYAGGNGFQTQGPDQDPYRQPKKKMPKWIKVACLGLVFGLVAGASFQTVNVIGDRILVPMIIAAAGRLSRHLHPVMQNLLLLQEAQCPRILPRSLQMRCLLSYPSQT